MEFRFSQEQQMIFDTAAAYLAQTSDSSAVRAAMVAPHGYDRCAWQRQCEEMFWQGLLVPESCDGLGLGFVEAIGLLEKMGERLVCTPFISSAVVVTSALNRAASSAQQQHYFAELLAGKTATLAYQGQTRRWDASAVTARLTASGDGWQLDGDYALVPHGSGADYLLLAARDERGALQLALLPSATPGLTVVNQPTMDQTRPLASVSAVAVQVTAGQRLNNGQCCAQLLNQLIDIAAIAVAADQVGGAQQSLNMAVDYTQERVQFGRTIASFQAIKHKAADMMLKVEAARSVLYYAACVADEWRLAEADAESLAQAAAMAKSYCSDAYYFVAGSALQLFGGVGITSEYDIQLYFKRAKSTESFYGGGSYHRERVAAQLLDSPCEVAL